MIEDVERTQKARNMIVKCGGCGAEYEMPDFPGIIPIMKDCPECKQRDGGE